MDSENQGFPITAIREIKILQTLKHRNIIQLRDVVASAGTAGVQWLPKPDADVISQTLGSAGPSQQCSWCSRSWTMT